MNHNIIHDEFIKNGWPCVAGPCVAGPCVAGPCVAGPCVSVSESVAVAGPCKYTYNKYNTLTPYDDFIIEYISPDEVSVTVPIPFRESSISYTNTFYSDDMITIHNYIKLHLSNQPVILGTKM